MEEQKKIFDLLKQIPQPGLLVKEDQILGVNQAAAALLLAPGQAFSSLLNTGSDDYAAFRDGQICVTLAIGGTCRNAVIIRMDVTDFILLDSDETMEEFRSMALASMQMRMPLMQAISSAQVLAENSADPAAAKLNQSLMQMLRLVSNMSDISQYAAASRMELRDVDSFLLELFEKAQNLTAGAIRLSYEGLKQPVFSLVDPEQLERAVWNILSNCIKFTPDGGMVCAKLTRQGNRLLLTVEDSGSGIAENIRSTLFCQYLRQPGIEDPRHGLGLGLSIIRTAAANHGGTVLIREGNNGGTKITMTLAIRQNTENRLQSPMLRPDYSGGWDHGLLELSDCLPAKLYQII